MGRVGAEFQEVSLGGNVQAVFFASSKKLM